MSAWDDRNGGAPAVAGTGGSRQFNGGGVGLPSGQGGVYSPTPSGGGAGPAGAQDTQPGVISINPLAPGNTNLDPVSSLFNGLRQGLVGGNENRDRADFQDHSLLGGVPVVGNVLRGAANVLGAGGEVVGAGVNAVGGALERVPTGGSGPLDAAFEEAKATAMQTENGRKLFEEAQAAMDKEHGLFGTGLLDNDEHLKSVFIRKVRQDDQYAHPSLAPGAFTPPGSIADELNTLFDTLGVSAEVAAKGWAQLDTPGQGGMDRIDLINAVGDKQVAFNEDKGLLGTGALAGDPTTGLNDMEKLVYVKMKNGDWTRDQAADFLASNGQAFGHSAVANIGGGLALDPLNVATFGAGAVAKVGAKGLLMASRFESATAKLAEVGKALEEATAAREAATGKRAIKLTDAALATAKENVDAAKVSLDSLNAYHSGGSVRGINFLARGAEGSDKIAAGFRLAGRAYGALEGTSIGRAAKVTRTLIDPLHAVDLHMPGASRLVDLYSDSIPRSVVDTLGVQHYKGILDEALRLDNTRGMYDQLSKDIGVASSNMGREGLVDMFRADQIAGNLGEELMNTLPEDIIATAVQTTKQHDLEKWLRLNAVKHVLKEDSEWTAEAHASLAQGLEQTYHTRSAADWMEAFKGMSKEQKSLYKFAVYGNTNRALLDFVANMAPDVAAKLPVPAGRMTLIAKGTLTRVGGESLLTKLTVLKTTKSKLKLIREWQDKYASLRYVTMDPANLDRSVDNFVQNLEDNMDRLPMQMTEDELAALGPDADALKSVTGDYSLGFRPDDQFLWGLERENATGLYRPAGAAWADHVGDGAMAYRPARALRLNIAGHPLVDVPVLRAGVKAVDTMDSAVRLMKSQVTSAMVTEAARKRFVSQSTVRFAEHGVTEQVANSWFDRITEYTREHQGYSGPRGMGGDELYNAIKSKGLIPQPLMNGERMLGPDDIMRLVLEGYDGDMRYIGLTQKLSGRAKRMLFETTGSNFAGQIAEHAWPTLKFRYNPIFQLQEKIEPWVLNAQRGVSFATGVNMSEADRLTESLLQKMTDNSLVRQADLDQFEYSSAVLFGKTARKTAAKQGSALNRLVAKSWALGDVQGMKRINMLRTFRKGLGKELRGAWEESNPGVWDQMKEAADLKAGRILNEDDFALQLVSENAYANDVFVSRVADTAGQFTKTADWANAIKTGAWHTPTTLGELKALDLEHVVQSLRIVSKDGSDIKDLTRLRQVLATEPDAMDKVVDGLTRLGADPDYIRRTKNALDFSWGGFWKTAEQRFGLQGDESRKLQDMMAQAASLRDMTPVEFMSQVFSPSLIDGTEGVLGHLEGTVRILRDARAAGRKIKPSDAKVMESRTRLAGKEGVSTREDLVRQLSKTFSAHLDPSAKRALLLEFQPELHQAVLDGNLKMDLNDVQSLWDDMADNELSDRILGYMDGKAGAGAHDVISEDARGVAAVRKGAAEYMARRGVTPLTERRNYAIDEPHYDATAKAYGDLPSIEYDKTGRKPTIKQISAAGTDLKPKPAGVDDRTYQAYQDFVIDTRAQWDHITAPTSKGGLGIKVIVAKGDPYVDSAAMRADVAKGQLRVLGGSSDHPLMTNEQNVMFRAVHDIFGHAAEGFEFGPRGELNAAAKHAQMYSDTGRAAMLTETHGQTSYVNYSEDIYQPVGVTRVPLDAADPAGSFEQRYPFEVPEGQAARLTPDMPRAGAVMLQGADEYGIEGDLPYAYTQRVGDGLRKLPADQQAAILQPLADIFDEFPNLRVHHIDVVDFSAPLDMIDLDQLTGLGQKGDAFAMTWGADRNESVILFNSSHLERHGADWSGLAKHNQLMGNYDTFYRIDKKTGKVMDLPRESRFGAPFNAGDLNIAQVSRHEAGHAFDVARRPRIKGSQQALPENAAYGDMMTRFEQDAGRLDLSEYGMKSSEEFAAELFSYSTNPDLIVANIASPELRSMVEEFQSFLKDSGEWVPVAKADPLAGKTIREVNAIKRGTAYAPQKAGILPQNILDQFGEQFVGKGKHVESNPDVARAAQMFGKWTDAVVTNGLLKGENAVHAGVLHDIAGMPTAAAVPYNFTEGATVNLAMQSMVRKWDDAFRLQYFSQERSFLERSLNHPMFGMYPASYMWGKIMPELVRTLALNPFGNKTGGLLRSAMDVQASIALRREYDPTFDAKIEQLGHSQALGFLGYLLPTLPWDISSSAPAWMRAIADQGIANSKAAPGKQKDISLLQPATDTLKKLAPLTTTLPWAGRAIDELNGPANAAETTKNQIDLKRAVKASELQPTMQRVMQELQEALR